MKNASWRSAPGEVHLAEDCAAEVRPVEVQAIELGPTKVRADVGVFITPGVPRRDAILEYCDVLVVRWDSRLPDLTEVTLTEPVC